MLYNRDQETNFQLDRILNHGIQFEDNVRGGYVEITLTGEEQQVEHNLGYVPSGYLVILKSAEFDIWTTADQLVKWTSTVLSLQSSVTNETARLFVM
jgi:hypothetical protein